MNYGELRSHFLDLMNRSDCSEAKADTFISMGLRRVERLLRTPLQRRTLEVTTDAINSESLNVPSDYLGVHEIRVDGRRIYRTINAQQDTTNGYYLERGAFKFSPSLPIGVSLELEYYTEFDDQVPVGAVTGYSLVLADVVLYSAMVFACDHFIDERKASFESTLATLIAEVQTMADLDEMVGGLQVTPYGGGIV